MKFAQKLVLFIITIISIILACSRYMIVKNNFLHAIETCVLQNTNHHALEKYVLESQLIKEIQTR